MKPRYNISIDTYDFILITALIGGFITDIWLPLAIFVVFAALAVICENEPGANDKDIQKIINPRTENDY